MESSTVARSQSLRSAARAYHSRTVTWQRMAPMLVAAGARLSIRRFGRPDIVAVGLAVAAYPALEWVTHHHVLHALPLAGRPGDASSPAAQSHIAHHRDPDDLDLLFVPLDVVPKSVVAVTAAAIAITPRTKVPLTGLATGLLLMSTYHWVHYLMHAPYLARTRWLQRLEANHMSHHHSAVDQWRMGVLFSTGDRVVGRIRHQAERAA